MSTIHYFQRYSQAENVATNNTLLLFSRLYQHSPNKFNIFLKDLLNDTDFKAGVLFNQQEKSSNSIPDGIISQISFKVAIETKLHNKFSVEQLTNHLNSFKNEELKVLLSLSPKEPSIERKSEIEKNIKDFNPSIKYIPTTFKVIVEKIRNVINDYEFELNQIIDDFEDYCLISHLIMNDEFNMRVVTCGSSLEENFKFNLYYAPSERGYSEHKYLGIYSDKSVRGIGEISNIIMAEFKNNNIIIKESTKKVTEEQENNIKEVIVAAKSNNNWDISEGHNFFCVDKFYETNYRKATKFPLQGTKFFDLRDILQIDKLPNVENIALQLNNKVW